jgi:hypothetical protein
MVHSGTEKSSHGRVNSFQKPCLYCEDKSHTLEGCQKFKSQLFNDRIEFLKSYGLCFGCLRLGHQRSTCRNKATCCLCNRRHPTILHIEGTRSVTGNVTESVGGNSTESGIDHKADQSPVKLHSHTGAGNCDSVFAVVPV